MDHAQARRPRAYEQAGAATPRALRAVPDDLTPAERRDWQALAERRKREPGQPGASPPRRRGREPASPAARVASPRPPASGLRPGYGERASDPAAPDRRPRSATGRGAGAGRRAAAPSRGPGPHPAAARGEAETRGSAGSPRRRRSPSLSIGASPDRLALWALVMCLFMALVAAATARGDEPDDREPAAEPPAAVETRR